MAWLLDPRSVEIVAWAGAASIIVAIGTVDLAPKANSYNGNPGRRSLRHLLSRWNALQRTSEYFR
jgi:hypothetical protein